MIRSEASDIVRPRNDDVRNSAVLADATSTAEIHLALLWNELVRGIRRVEDCFFDAERCYLVLALVSHEPIAGQRREILESVLNGQRQKNIAIDAKLAPSTVALNSRLALESLGVDAKPSRAHPLLMLAARAATIPLAASARCSTILTPDGRELRVVSIARPDLGLSGRLPPAELAVIRCLVEGDSYRDIADRRQTSTRTIANQISAVFRRLHVSGRNDLVQRLFAGEAPNQPRKVPPESTPPTQTGAEFAAQRSA